MRIKNLTAVPTCYDFITVSEPDRRSAELAAEENASRHSLSERLLLLFSGAPAVQEPEDDKSQWPIDTALDKLCARYPDFLQQIAGKDVLDHGCGRGLQSLALALRGAGHVLGFDTRISNYKPAEDQVRRLGLEGKVEFRGRLDPALDGRFDIVISKDSMEHYPDPARCLAELARLLKPDGRILLTFGPPWFAPYGSHMQFFTRIPWVNLLFSEKTVMNVRAHFRSDGATCYEEVLGGLNRMTIKKFDRLLAAAGLRVLYCRYDGVRGLGFLTKIPLLRELFTNNIHCELAKN